MAQRQQAGRVMAQRPDYITVAGCNPHPGVEAEEYMDFFGSCFPVLEVRKTLLYGNFPPGLLLVDEYGVFGVVVGRAGKPQRVMRVTL